MSRERSQLTAHDLEEAGAVPSTTQVRNGQERPLTPSRNEEIRVGVVHWHSFDDGSIGLITGVIQEMGYSVVDFLVDEPLPPDLDLVLIFGPSGPIAPLVFQLLQAPPDRRPPIAFMHAEQLPDPRLPKWAQLSIGTLRSWIERSSYRKGSDGVWRIAPFLRWTSLGAMRFRYYGDLHWLRREQLLATLAMASVWRAKRLRMQGFDVMGAPAFGYPMTPEWGANLGLERDIPVLWLGKPGSRRRRNLLGQVRTSLRSRGIEMMVVDGEENPYVFGKARTELLNRTKIVLNLLRQPFDENGGRLYLASANSAMVVTEPLLPHHPAFVPSVHLVESPVERMAETIEYYLHHEAERRQIALRAHELVTTEMTVDKTVKAIMADVLAKDRCRNTRVGR